MDYTEEQRQVFGPYDAGNGLQRHADPLAAYLDMCHMLDGDPGGAIADLKSADSERRYAATKRIEAAGRQVFGMMPFDPETGGGARLSDVLAVVKSFTRWLADQKKSGSTTAPSPTPE